MNVGILTFHHAANYGAVWQATSLALAISKLGHTVEMIDYRPQAAVRVYRKAMLSGRYIPWNIIKSWKLLRDLKSKVQLSSGGPYNDRSQLSSLASRYDIVVVGSDEVWNIEGMRGWDPAYFLDFIPDGLRKVSYAASTGHRIDITPHRDEMARLLARFDAISVRDHTSAEVIQQLTGRRSPVVVDPTLLSGIREQIPVGNHIALYGGLTNTSKDWLRRVASNRGLKVVSVGFSNRMGGRIRIQAGLDEWLNTIGSAQLVITTTFHGVLACITQKRPFLVLPRFDKATKVKDFLAHCGLQDRFLDPAKLPPSLDFTNSIDYETLWSALAEDIAESQNFLSGALAKGK